MKNFFVLVVFIITEAISEDSIVISVFNEGNLPGNITTIPANLDSFLTASGNIITSRIQFLNSNLRIVSLACDQGNNTIFFNDLSTQSIYRLNHFNSWLNDSELSYSVIHRKTSFVESQLSYDWLNRNLYWTDGVFSWIVINPAYVTSLSQYKIIVSINLTRPYAIATDPNKEYLFWSDIATNPLIERSSLSGDGRTTLVYRALKNPTSLVADELTQTIFWSDSSRDTIEACTYTGQNRRVLTRINSAQLTSLAIHKDIVCAADPKNRRFTCHRTSSGEVTIVISGFKGSTWALALYESSPRTLPASPCQSKLCEDICVTRSGVAQCLCGEGSTLNQDGITCTSIHGLYDKGILLSNSTNICILEIRLASGLDHDATCIFSTASGSITHLDTDGNNSYIFYADISKKEIIIHDRITRADYTLVSTSNVSGLAYDWINSNMYWSESDTGRIKVVSVSTRNSLTVFDNIPTPTRIVIDPFNSTLFWIANEVSGTQIQRGRTDGTQKQVVISGGNTNDPSALFFDTLQKRLYWSNAGSLKSINPNGTDIRHYFSIGTTSNLFIYKNYIIWTTISQELRTAKLTSTTTEIIKNMDAMGTIKGMTVFDRTLQRAQKGECETGNGGCEEICLTTEFGKTCKCSLGFELDTDQRSCTSVPFSNNFLLVTDYSHNKIYQVSLTNKSVVALDLPFLQTAVGVAFNHKSKMIFWSEVQTGQIRQSSLNGKNSTIVYSLGFAFADRLAIDFSTENIYFSEVPILGSKGSLKVVHSGSSPKTVINNLNSPRAVALYPSRGYLFWTAHDANTSHIARSNMDGSSRTILVSVSTKWPNGLAIDYTGNRLYWTDGYHNKIETSDLNGGNRRELLLGSGVHFMALILQGSYLYCTDWTKQKILKIDKDTGQEEIWMSDIAEFGRLDSLDIYPGDTQPVNSYCSVNNGRCSTYCLPTISGRTCTCEDGVNLKSDGRTCDGVTQCSNSIPNGYLDSACLRYVGQQCTYGCSTGYIKNTSIPNITCDQSGFWKQNLQQLCNQITCDLSILNGNFTDSCEGNVNIYCQYNCNAGYEKNPSYTNIHCSTSGVWVPSTDQLCRRIQCSQGIKNGFIVEPCNRYSGEECSYNCSSGYKNDVSIDKILCLSNGQWNTPVNELCKEIKCSKDIQNGSFQNCPGNIGSACQFDCDTGFAKKNGVSTVYCLSMGQWTENITGLCLAIKCDLSIPNGNFTDSCGGNVNTNCQYSCNADYEKNPSYTITHCSTSGVWVPSTDQLCNRIQCSLGIKNGFLVQPCNRFVGEECSYNCSSGYKKDMSIDKISCLLTGEWNEPADELCKEIRCSTEIKNGSFQNCPATVGSACQFYCDNDFVKKDDVSTLYCLASGQWTENITKLCLPIKCPEFDVTGFLNPTCQMMVNEICSYSCSPGYDKNTSINAVTCMQNGEWNYRPDDVCTGMRCPKNIKNGMLDEPCDRQSSHSCNYSCNIGFTKTAQMITCIENGTWDSDTNGICIAKQCPDLINNGQLEGPCTRQTLQSCNYSCIDGFRKTKPLITCQIDGSWKAGNDNLCTVISCKKEINNGKFLDGCKYTIGAICTFKCDEGFKSSKDSLTSICTKTGRWEDVENSLCIAKSDTPSSSQLNIAAIGAGIGVPLLLIVILAIAMTIVLIRRRRGRKDRNTEMRHIISSSSLKMSETDLLNIDRRPDSQRPDSNVYSEINDLRPNGNDQPIFDLSNSKVGSNALVREPFDASDDYINPRNLRKIGSDFNTNHSVPESEDKHDDNGHTSEFQILGVNHYSVKKSMPPPVPQKPKTNLPYELHQNVSKNGHEDHEYTTLKSTY